MTHPHSSADTLSHNSSSAILKHGEELHDLGFNAGWNGAVEESAKLVENFDCHLAGYPNDEAQQYYESGVADACNMLEERIRLLAAQPPAAPVETEKLDATEQGYLEDNIATVAHHLGQPGAFLSVHYDGSPKLLVEPGSVLPEISRRLAPPQSSAETSRQEG